MASAIASSSLAGSAADQRHLAQPCPAAAPTMRWKAASVDAHLRLGLHQVGLGLLEARLGLRDVGDRQLADAEAFARGVELLDQHPDVVPARIGDGDVLASGRRRT